MPDLLYISSLRRLAKGVAAERHPPWLPSSGLFFFVVGVSWGLKPLLKRWEEQDLGIRLGHV